jgi:hypothetical protein
MRVFFPSQIVADKEKDVAVTMVRESAEMSCAKTGITSKQEKQRKAKNNDVKVEYGWTGMELRSWWAVDS